jgi:hypothetical protein
MSSFINLIQGRKDFFWLKKEFKKDILEKNKRAIEFKKQAEIMFSEFKKQKKKRISEKKVKEKLVNTILDGYEMLHQLGIKTINDNKPTK